jgi:hypothetical protein
MSGVIPTGESASFGQTGDPTLPPSLPVGEDGGADARVKRARISRTQHPRGFASGAESDAVGDGITGTAPNHTRAYEAATNAALDLIVSAEVQPLADDVAGGRLEAAVRVFRRRG